MEYRTSQPVSSLGVATRTLSCKQWLSSGLLAAESKDTLRASMRDEVMPFRSE